MESNAKALSSVETIQSVKKFDVFVSYSHEDRGWVNRQLLPRLKGAGLEIEIDQNWMAGEPLPEKIERAIGDAPHTVVVLSENWLKSKWCALERRLISMCDLDARERRLIPVLRSDCRDQLPASIASLVYRDFSGDSVDEDEWETLLQDLGAELKGTREKANRGFTALAKLMQSNSHVLAAVISSQAALTGVSEKIQALVAYKEIHDCFQKLESSHKVLLQDVQALSADPCSWEAITRDEALSFRARLNEVVAETKQAPFADQETVLVERLELDATMLRRSIEDRDADTCRNVVKHLEMTLQREPARINNRLLDKANELQLSHLVDELSNIERELATVSLSSADAKEREAFDRSVDVMAKYAATLNQYVTCHNILQSICDELSATDPFRFKDIHQFETAWMYLEQGLQRLRQESQLRCLAPIWEPAETLRQELRMTRNLHKLRNCYLDYQSAADSVFNKVNYQLLDFCRSKLTDLGNSLVTLLERMQNG